MVIMVTRKFIYIPSNSRYNFVAARLSYSVLSASPPDIVVINHDTGALRLVSSLSSVTSELVNVTVRVSDGDGSHDQLAHLTMHVVDENRYVPVFGEDAYSLSLEESTAVGTTVLQVSAEDADSSELSFSIVSGNTGNVFSLKPLSGEASCNRFMTINRSISPDLV